MLSLFKRKDGGPSWFNEHPIAALRHDMDSLLQNFFGEGEMTSWREGMDPRFDVSESDTEIEVTTDLPGFKPDEVNIEVRENMLTISGEHREERKENGDGKKYHRLERRIGSFSRSVWLPCAIDEEKIDAELKQGVLTIKLPKCAEAQRKKIPVKG
jgi:HSP20 family protein